MPVLDPQALIDDRVHAIRSFHEAVNTPKAELDLSGGLDSAVMLGLLARALGPEHITTVHSRIHSSPEHTARAQETADAFGVPLVVIDLTDLYEQLTERMIVELARAQRVDPALIRQRCADDPVILGSIRSCIRAPIGRGFNRLALGGIRHGTGNECEDRWLRFFQKGGDGEVDTNPIAMLAKGEVFQLARALGVPESTLAARPSPDLWGKGDGHNDEDELAVYLGRPPEGHTFYSYIDLETGRYSHVGLIERVSRLLDLPADHNRTIEQALFEDGDELPRLAAHAKTFAAAGPLDVPDLQQLLHAARRVERITRHKLNPNCPTLGGRALLVARGILTDTLPEV